jgi:tight adherence protein C
MQFILQYPEFILAGLLGAAVLIRRADGEAASAPLVQVFLDIARALVYLMPERYLAWLQRSQAHAGWRSSAAVGSLCALKVYPAAAIALIVAFFNPLASIAALVVLFFIPDTVVTSVRLKRQNDIVIALPQALDLMVLCIDAGLGLDAALHRVAGDQSVLSGALSEELSLLNRDILLGMDRERAYEDLYVRSGVEDLRTFGSALNQSSKLGLSISHVIRSQSDFVRLRHQQRAEEKAAKVAIWMVFPLWFCIMPALMVILLAPSIIVFFKTLAHFPPEWFM